MQSGAIGTTFGQHIERENAKMLYPQDPTKYICDVVAMI
jgi:hypothetical protein